MKVLRIHDLRGFCDVCGAPVRYHASIRDPGARAREDCGAVRCERHETHGGGHRLFAEGVPYEVF